MTSLCSNNKLTQNTTQTKRMVLALMQQKDKSKKKG